MIGWCFGGGWSLRTALALPQKIDATVIYYGELVTDRDRLATLDMPVLGNFGAEDQGITPDKVHRFESTLKDLGKDVDVKIYDGAGHAFANPSGRALPAAGGEGRLGAHPRLPRSRAEGRGPRSNATRLKAVVGRSAGFVI